MNKWIVKHEWHFEILVSKKDASKFKVRAHNVDARDRELARRVAWTIEAWLSKDRVLKPQERP